MKWIEEDEPVVLSLYSVNDEIEGMQLYVARGERRGEGRTGGGERRGA